MASSWLQVLLRFHSPASLFAVPHQKVVTRIAASFFRASSEGTCPSMNRSLDGAQEFSGETWCLTDSHVRVELSASASSCLAPQSESHCPGHVEP